MKKILLIILASLFYSFSFAQSADDMGVLRVPNKFNDYVYEREMNAIYDGSTALDLIVKEADIDNPWIVYSDRNKNVIVDAPNGYKVDGQSALDIGDRLHVFEVQGSWLKVGEVTREDGVWKKDIKGWIKAEKLILSPYAVLGVTGGPKKGMILTSVSSFNKGDDLTEILSKKHFYKDPTCKETNISKNKARKFEFLFILKSNSNSMLMSYSDNLSLSSKSKSNIRGWLQKSKVTKWEHRVCLEPNSSAEAVRAYKGQKLYVIDDEGHFDRFLDQGSLPNDEWAIREIELINRRPFALQMRMPILPWKYETAKNKKVAAIAQMVTKKIECDCPDGTKSEECCDEGGGEKIDPGANLQDILAKATTKLSKYKAKRNTINLLFVLDGTRSMKNYGPAMARSIKEVILKKKSEGTNDQYRFGLAVYRHYTDDPDGKLFEFIPLQGDENQIIEKLESITYDSKNKVHQESHYYGMKEAIKRAKFDKNQTNIIVLVGDAGNIKNDERGIRKDDIINLLYEKNISLLSYQVNFLDNAAYGAFNMDVYSYMKKVGLKYVSNSTFYNKCTFQDLGNNTIKLSFGSAKVKEIVDEESVPMFGKFKFANRGDKIDVSLFESNLQTSLNEYLDMLEGLEDKMRRIIDLDSPEGESEDNEEDADPLDVFTEAFVELLRKQGFSDMDIEILKRQGEISSNGFLSLRTGGIDIDAFKPVIFISKDFKDVLNKRLETLAGRPDATGAEARAYLYNSMIDIVKAIMGEETSKQMIEKKTFNEIWLQILGVEFAGNSFLKGMEIYKIKTELDDDQFMDFYLNFATQVDEFIQAEYDDAFSRWEKAGQTYYWIPLTDVPGCE